MDMDDRDRRTGPLFTGRDGPFLFLDTVQKRQQNQPFCCILIGDLVQFYESAVKITVAPAIYCCALGTGLVPASYNTQAV